MSEPHPWKLCAPWYRWKQQGAAPRETRPVFQKYETSDLVNAFLADPQASLQFLPEDEVQTLVPTETLPNGKRKLFATEVAKPSGIRKLFLTSHRRFYLVVCELHCDMPGFPSADRGQVCEAGLVVRRRRTIVKSPAKKLEAEKILKDLSLAKAKLEQLEAEELGAMRSTKARMAAMRDAIHTPLRRKKEALAEAALHAQKRLASWAEGAGVVTVVEGWVPKDFDGIGAWEIVGDTPQGVRESVFPLYPLVPDPRKPDHAGKGRTIYFGLVPVGSSDTAEDGTPRFDEHTLYEIRCFVRHHKQGCPRKPTRGDCPGPIFWSRPTEPYKLAAHFDLVGTSNRPVTMQMPNVKELAAHAAQLSPAKVAAFRMASPNPESNLGFNVDVDAQKGTKLDPGSQAEICSFSIPLITIVATFVFKLFLPIVVFVFQLWFLLKLRFCIPPSVSVDADLTAALDAATGGLDVDIDIGIDAQAAADLRIEIDASIEKTLGSMTSPKPGVPPSAATQQLIDDAVDDMAIYGNAAVVGFEADLTTEFKDDKAASLSANLKLEARAPWSDAEVA